MRISFCGASGTGKTTLMNAVHARFGWPICPVGSRSVSAAMGFASPYDVDAAGKRAEFQRRLFEEKHAWEEAHEDFVTDRTHLDNLIYSSMHGAAESIDYAAYMKAMDRYDIIFYCAMDSFHHLGSDPMRIQSLNYHRLFDSFIQGLLYVELPFNCGESVWVQGQNIDQRKSYTEYIINTRQVGRR